MSDPAAPIALDLERVSVAYDGGLAVDGVSARVATGDRLALLGPSGCGKTSLLRAVAGLEPLAGGSIAIAGHDTAGVPTFRRDIGLMFQGHALFPHLDVAGNVEFGLRMARWPKDQARARVADMLDLVGLADRATSPVTQLSGGEQQRVALARTLAPEPALVLLDEPLASLDRALRQELLATMRQAFDATSTTVVFVTHDQSEAFQMGDVVAVMRAGRIVREGTPDQVWADPQQEWVARFLGLTNVFDASHPLLAAPALGLLRGDVPGRDDARFLLRPELLSLRPPDAATLPDAAIPATSAAADAAGLIDAADLATSAAGSQPPDARAAVVPGRVSARVFRAGLSVVSVDLDARPDPGDSVEVWVTGPVPPVGDPVRVVIPSEAVVALQ